MPKPYPDFPKLQEEWKRIVLKDWPSRVMLGMLTLFCTYIFAHGKDTIKAEGQKLVLETVRPSMDSLRSQVDTLKGQVADLQAEQEKSGRIQQEFFGAMMEAIPGLKKAVEERGKQNSDVVHKKAETDQLLKNLTEIKR